MRKLLLFLLFSISIQFTYSQGTAQDSAWIRDNYFKTETYIPMRDGVKLFTTIYAPKDSTQRHPILMTRTPYSCAPYGKDKWRNFLRRLSALLSARRLYHGYPGRPRPLDE